MNHETKALILASALALWPADATAQPADREAEQRAAEEEADEIVITASKQAAPAAEAVLGEDELARERMSKTADGLLGHMAGIDLNRQSPAGSESGRVRMRGFDESRLLVELDGRSLNGAGVYGGYYVDWASLSLEDVERIEIIRGTAPVKYGNTLGGVLNIVTRTGSTQPRTAFRTAGGSLASWDAQASHAWGFGPLRYSVSAGHHETDGYLRNASLERNTIAGKLTFLLPADLELTSSVRYTQNECGMVVYNRPDSPYYDPDRPSSIESPLGGPYVPFANHGQWLWGALDWGDRSHWNDGRLQLDLALRRDTDLFDLTVRAYLMEQERKEYFYAIDDPRHLVLERGSEPEKHNWGWKADLKNVFEALGAHVVEYGAAGSYLGSGDMRIGQLDAGYFFPQALPEDSSGKAGISMLHGIYLQDQWQIMSWLDLELGLRFDHFEADGPEQNAPTVDASTWSPRLAVTFHPWEGGYVAGRYRWSHRFPTLPEYYWWYSGYQPESRPDLGPEHAHQVELEVGHRMSDLLTVVLRAYRYDVDGYIRTIFGYRPSRVVYHIDEVDLTGVELECTCDLPYNLSVFANFTWQLATKSGDVLDSSSPLSEELLELPRNKVNLGVGYFDKEGLQARFTGRYVDLRRVAWGDLSTANGSRLEKLSPFVDLDLYASYPVFRPRTGGEVRFEVSVENLLNHHYVEEYGFPMPGIMFMAGIRTTL
ncbi:MAG: TonB-dependent receptor [Deltaproteobacteria bacterium]|nr:TonB-dependent receptor [Deltaproteobacteria bacterium]